MASFFADLYDKARQEMLAKYKEQLDGGNLSQAEYDDAVKAVNIMYGDLAAGGKSNAEIQADISASPGSQQTISAQGKAVLGNTPNVQAASSDPNAYKMLQMHLAALSDQAYRPEMAAARTRALQSQMEAYKPMQNVMGAMYGPQGQIDMTKATQNPLTQAMMRLGAPNKNDIGLAPPGSPNAAGYRQGPVGNAASAAAPVTYPDASITLGPPPPAPAGLHRGPDGKLYDAQGRLVSG